MYLNRPGNLSKVAHHLVGDKQSDCVKASGGGPIWRPLEGAGKSGWKNDDPAGPQFGCRQNGRVSTNCPIDKALRTDLNGRKDGRYSCAG